ncbi:uncharacterized protein [Onthophagus taurus]|uniref:uncharacterized protein n=1 Tax=Onthophagus taurus TaxID=166361 RepID=UPI000C200E72|nr:uncharacterized protein LOC111424754 isoform X2 [Onthophagus taurus]
MHKYALNNVFCCCGDLRKGTIVIACIHMILALFFLARLTISLEDPNSGLLTLSTILLLSYMICNNVVFFRAVELEQPNNMLSWLILNGSVSFNGIWVYSAIAYTHTIYALILTTVFCIYFYCVVVVFSYYWHLKYDADYD